MRATSTGVVTTPTPCDIPFHAEQLSIAAFGYERLPFTIFSLSSGNDSCGRTPYFRRRALPQGQPPKVRADSNACRSFASLLPFRARVQTGQRFSQKSGSKIGMLMLSSVRVPLPPFLNEVDPEPATESCRSVGDNGETRTTQDRSRLASYH